MLSASRIVRAWRARIAAMLALLLTISIVGQQLPCMHATAVAVDTPTQQHEHAPAAHHQHDQASQSEQMPTQAPAPSSHHDPAAPGCAQLLACGLVVQSASTTIAVLSAVTMSREAPVGVPLAFATAELEVESPPPRA
jgi:hypothetical protein